MESIHLNIFNLICFIGLFSGIIFSVNLLAKSENKITSTIALMTFCICFVPFQKICLDILIHEVLLKMPLIPTDILVAPLFFILIMLYLKGVFYKKWLYFSIGVFVLLFCYHIFFSFQVLSISLESYIQTSLYFDVFTAFFSLAFFIPALMEVYEKRNSEIKWLKKIVFAGALIQVFFLLIIALLFIGVVEDSMMLFYPLWMLISVVALWICYEGIPKEILEIED